MKKTKLCGECFFSRTTLEFTFPLAELVASTMALASPFSTRVAFCNHWQKSLNGSVSLVIFNCLSCIFFIIALDLLPRKMLLYHCHVICGRMLMMNGV